jgi:MoaA/NifB/PqqE/SkfB family radical SAM enzyme
MMLSPRGDAFVCCHSPVKATDENDVILDFQKDKTLTLNKVLNSHAHKELRKEFIANKKSKACETCWSIEAAGGHSPRQGWLDLYGSKTEHLLKNTEANGELKNPQLNFLQISLGNKCNIKCRTCNPSNSIQWVKESEKYETFPDVDLPFFKNIEWYKRDSFKADLSLHLPHSNRLNFLGGEPLIIEEHYQILEELIRIGRAKEVELQYNTNVTTYNEKLISYWKQFKKVFVCLSVDAVGEANDYLRHPSKWDLIEKNIYNFLNAKKELNLEVYFASTFNALNVEHLPELYRWLYNLKTDGFKLPLLTWVDYPAYLDARVLPKAYREKIYKKNVDTINSLKLGGSAHWGLSTIKLLDRMMEGFPEPRGEMLWQRFKTVTRQIDESRKENLTAISPELGRMVYDNL